MNAAELKAWLAKAKKPKYGRRRAHITPTGERFASEWEAKVCGDLRLIHGPRNVIRQVSLPVENGSERMIVDFLVIHERFDDGTFRAELVDAKGHATSNWLTKANRLLNFFGLTVRRVNQ